MPSRRRPPCRIWSAKIGISTAYGMPDRLTRPSSSSRARIGAVSRDEPEAFDDLVPAPTRRVPARAARRRASSAAPAITAM